MKWRRFKKIERLEPKPVTTEPQSLPEPKLSEEDAMVVQLIEEIGFCKCEVACDPQLNHKIAIYKWFEDIGKALKDNQWINKLKITHYACLYELNENWKASFCCTCIKKIKAILEADHQAKIEKQYQKWKESRVKK